MDLNKILTGLLSKAYKLDTKAVDEILKKEGANEESIITSDIVTGKQIGRAHV